MMDDTDWPQALGLYDLLDFTAPTPFNRAVAAGRTLVRSVCRSALVLSSQGFGRDGGDVAFGGQTQTFGGGRGPSRSTRLSHAST
jgi:hypothetical protein